jgi:uncharacterized membrane protein (UPF0127 family)
MKAVNLRSKKEIAGNVAVATRMFERMKGLLGQSAMVAGDGLLIKPCNSVHTFGMKFPIDVVFLNRNNVIIAVRKNLAQNRLTQIYLKAASVLELPAGCLDATSTNVGDEIQFG